MSETNATQLEFKCRQAPKDRMQVEFLRSSLMVEVEMGGEVIDSRG